MKCFNCGAVLKSTDYCSQCGADVKLYRRMLQLSNAYYNEGLEKARVRDLSGAVISLRQSLRLNKKNTDARNLLGLVSFEMGEVVEALSQWIISRSFQGQKNLADHYIESVQSNPAKLDTINTTIRKYNQSLVYCEQQSYDLAIIQLKKVLSMNMNLLDGHLLLALLYMKAENYGRARNELRRVLAIDRTNTRALRYMKEVDAAGGKQAEKETVVQSKDAIAYTSGNETIIQPVGVKDNSGLHSVLNVVIGLAIGAAVMWFLVLPAQQQMRNGELNDAVAEYSDQLDSRTAALEALQSEMDGMEQRVQEAEQTAQDAQTQLDSQQALLAAYRAYAEGNAAEALTQLETVEQDGLSDDAQALYDFVFSEVGTQAVRELYQTGYAAYESGDYATAIADLQKCYELDNSQGDALYFLARAYHRSGDTENAKTYYQKVVEELPGTRRATDAQSFLDGLQ
ncbi:MAG: tetratricopeptide repeat protein [Eubacteriales bacterium]|nr:tetratricopeptide repeat protein [Eubacteriales bacterium]